jgi:UDP-N-acetyl-D-mannosaminuronic acid transferase (WecB/TagA/CpsF family)
MDKMLEYSSWTRIAVGAAFDFHSGAVKRAPKFVFAVLFGYWRGNGSR